MLQWVPNSPPSDIEQASKYSNGSLFYIYLPRNGSLMKICVFCNYKKTFPNSNTLSSWQNKMIFAVWKSGTAKLVDTRVSQYSGALVS